jgi:hypothetical protein
MANPMAIHLSWSYPAWKFFRLSAPILAQSGLATVARSREASAGFDLGDTLTIERVIVPQLSHIT